MSSGVIVKPNLFIVGAPKCGTTAWVQYLSTHPDICFSPVKEPHYFCTDLQWRNFHEEEEYLNLFKDCSAAKVVAEASVRYLCSTAAAENIRKFNPDARIIVFVRDQADHIPSLHNQMLYRSEEWIADFTEVWRLSDQRGKSSDGRTREPKFLDYKALGRFSEQVERYFAVFPAEQVRVFDFHDWSHDPRTTYLEILRFLRLRDDGRSEFPKINEAKHQHSPWLARQLIKPPPVIKLAAPLLKRVLGRSGLDRIVGFALKLNRREGYLGGTSDTLRQEIRAYYAEDNALLEARIWKPSSLRQLISSNGCRDPGHDK